MKEKVRFLGLDVHAETIAAAIAERRRCPLGGPKMSPRRTSGASDRAGRRAAKHRNAEPILLAPRSVSVGFVVTRRRTSSPLSTAV